MNPDPFTFRQLAWMVEGKQRDEWWRWSTWIAAYLNTQIDPKKTAPFHPRDFDPFVQKPKERGGVNLTQQLTAVGNILSRGNAPVQYKFLTVIQPDGSTVWTLEGSNAEQS